MRDSPIAGVDRRSAFRAGVRLQAQNGTRKVGLRLSSHSIHLRCIGLTERAIGEDMRRRLVWLMVFLAAACTGSAGVNVEDNSAEGIADSAASSSTETTDEPSEDESSPTLDETATTLPVPEGLEGGRLKVILSGPSAGGPRSLEQLLAADPQLQTLVDEVSSFTNQTGIPVEYFFITNVLELFTRDCATDCSLDVVVLDNFFVQLFARNGWMVSLDESSEQADSRWDLDDMMPSVRTHLSFEGSLYGAPQTAHSSFLMYRTDLLDDAGLSIPSNPTWQQVAEVAGALDAADNGAAGICLQGDPSWSGSGAVFTSMLNTFGGSYWSANEDGTLGTSLVDQPEFLEAFTFYVDLLIDSGPEDPASLGFDGCLDLYRQGDVAMWFDSTAAGPLLESDESPVQGLNGYAQAPTVLTESASWISGRSFVVLADAVAPELSWEYIRWASGTGADDAFGNAAVARADFGVAWRSILEEPATQAVGSAYLDAALEAALTAPVENPGTTVRPGLDGVQYVADQVFPYVATKCMEQLALTLAGELTIESAVNACHDFASDAL